MLNSFRTDEKTVKTVTSVAIKLCNFTRDCHYFNRAPIADYQKEIEQIGNEIENSTSDWNDAHFTTIGKFILMGNFENFDFNSLLQLGNEFSRSHKTRAALIAYSIVLIAGKTDTFSYACPRGIFNKPSIDDLSTTKGAEALRDKFVEVILYLSSNRSDIVFYIKFLLQLEKIRRSKIVDAMELLPPRMLLSLLQDINSDTNANPFRYRFSQHTTIVSEIMDSSIHERLKQMHSLLECTKGKDQHELDCEDLDKRAQYYSSIGKKKLAEQDRVKSSALSKFRNKLFELSLVLQKQENPGDLIEQISLCQNNILLPHRNNTFYITSYYQLIKCRAELLERYGKHNADQEIIERECANLAYDLHKCHLLSPDTDKVQDNFNIEPGKRRLQLTTGYMLMAKTSAEDLYHCILKLDAIRQLDILRACVKDPAHIWFEKLQPLAASIKAHIENLNQNEINAATNAEAAAPGQLISIAPAATIFAPAPSTAKPARIEVKPIPEEAARRLKMTAMSFNEGL